VHVIFVQIPPDERARFDVYRRSRIQARHNSADVNRVPALKYARAELMVGIPAGSVMPGAQGNGRSVGRFLANAMRPGVRCLDTCGSSANQTRQRPDPRQIKQVSYRFHSLRPADEFSWVSAGVSFTHPSATRMVYLRAESARICDASYGFERRSRPRSPAMEFLLRYPRAPVGGRIAVSSVSTRRCPKGTARKAMSSAAA
jgi:hypothetical protein